MGLTFSFNTSFQLLSVLGLQEAQVQLKVSFIMEAFPNILKNSAQSFSSPASLIVFRTLPTTRALILTYMCYMYVCEYFMLLSYTILTDRIFVFLLPCPQHWTRCGLLQFLNKYPIIFLKCLDYVRQSKCCHM